MHSTLYTGAVTVPAARAIESQMCLVTATQGWSTCPPRMAQHMMTQRTAATSRMAWTR